MVEKVYRVRNKEKRRKIMAEESKVKVYGMWASAYVLRVKLALKIKGVEYEYIEEDLANKSELMLQYNPVYKKVPVLVHNGLPLAESLVILEYIDETWTNTPYLLPKDSYQRAKHRFWAAYFQQVSEIFGRAVILSTQGKPTEEMMKEFWNKMDVAEDFMKEILPNNSPSLQENFQPRYLDIVLYSFFGNCDVVEEFLGVKPLCTERFPLLTSWIKALCEVPEFKEVSVPVQKLVEFLRAMRQNNLSAPQA